jgi:hypothetical protein
LTRGPRGASLEGEGGQISGTKQSADRGEGEFLFPQNSKFTEKIRNSLNSRPRKPTAALELSGAFKKDPQRRAARQHEPIPAGPLGEPPEHFDEYHVKLWRELALQVPAGVLTISDRWIFEITCNLMAKFRKGAASAGDMTRLIQCIGRIGLDPSTRSSVSTPEKSQEKRNKFVEIAATPRPGTRTN